MIDGVPIAIVGQIGIWKHLAGLTKEYVWVFVTGREVPNYKLPNASSLGYLGSLSGR